MFQRLYKYKQINYDTRARICRRIYEMAALDFVLAHSSRKPEDYVLRRSNEGSYRLLNPGNNGSIFGKAPGFTVYTTTNEKTGQPIYSASRNKGKPLSYELFITDRVKNMKYNYDFTFGETLHKVLNNLRVKDFIDILTVDFQECGRFNRLYTHGEIFELSDQFKKHRELIRQNQHYFDA